jgi:hypothetical protein
MNDMDDTLNLAPLVHRDEVGETTLIMQGDSVPELLLPPTTPHQSCDSVSSSHRFLLVLLRALSAWNV